MSFATSVLLLTTGPAPAVSQKKQSDSLNPEQRVTFILRDHAQAQTVTIAGTFNGWNPQATPLVRKGADWLVELRLRPATYKYKFVIDGNRWTIDPQNSRFEDDSAGHFNSVIDIPSEPGPTSTLKPSSLHRRVDVGGYKLYINCEGRQRKGVPVVVMDSGLGDSSESWLGIQPQIREFARVCIYDRAGLGNSDLSTHVQTTTQIAIDLHNLLRGAGVARPLLLVGHSLGGINARLYASMYAKEVVGMVLVDSTHEEQFARMEALIPEAIKKQLPPSAFEVISNEKIDLQNNAERMARLRRWHADIPLIVLTAANSGTNPTGPLAFLAPQWENIRLELQQDLTHRSRKGKQIMATKSGHYIQRDEPDLVVNAIREVLAETTKPNHE